MNPIVRVKKDLSRKEFALKTGISYQTAASLENGYPIHMREKTATAIAEFAGIEPQQLQEEYKEWREGLKEQA